MQHRVGHHLRDEQQGKVPDGIAVVRDLNTKIAQFPSNIIAGMFNFKPREFFEISAPVEREVPKVSFGGATS